jgi:LruC domain-containing protein
MKIIIYLVVIFFTSDIHAWVYNKNDFDRLGKPKNLSDMPTFSEKFYSDIIKALPERKHTVSVHPEYFSTANTSIDLGENAEDVKVTFLHEGAGFKNTFGYISYTGAVPSIEEIKDNGILIFPNTSLKNSGGNLSYGDTYSLGSFPQGTKLLFFVLSNAWKSQQIQDTDWLFTTNLDHNPEAGDMNFIPLKQHVAMLWHEESEVIVLGFEDVLRTEGWCDHDFNDVMFTVSSTPSTAIEYQKYQVVPDPETINNNVTYNNGIIAYEDLWPHIGDFDFNDIVMYYSVTQTKDLGLVTDIKYEVTPQAMGAAYSNTFKLKINTEAGNIRTIQKTFNGKVYDLIKNGTIVNQKLVFTDGSGTVIEVIDNVKGAIPPPQNYSMSNTIKNSPKVVGKSITLDIKLYNGVTDLELGDPPYDSFISRIDSEGNVIEIHQLGRAPTQKASISLFGTGDDDSNIEVGQYYQTIDGKPWVILIPGTWDNPLEKIRIDIPYNTLLDWIASSGNNNKDWYYKNIKKEFTFIK